MDIRIEDFVTIDVARLIYKKSVYNLSYPHDYCYYLGVLTKLEDIPCGALSEVYLAPLLTDMQRWLREVANISVEVYTNASGWCWQICKAFKHLSVTCGTFIDDFTNHDDDELMNDGGSYDTYEAALNAGIREYLKTMKG